MPKEKPQGISEANQSKTQELGSWRKKKEGESKAKILNLTQNIQEGKEVAASRYL